VTAAPIVDTTYVHDGVSFPPIRRASWTATASTTIATSGAAVLPAEAGLTEWLHTVGPSEGWCAVTHPSQSVGLVLEFDPEVFKTTWLWGVYGGWRGHYVLLTEPCTSPPGGLAQNVADGTAAWLDGGAAIETVVTATVVEEVTASAGDLRPGRPA